VKDPQKKKRKKENTHGQYLTPVGGKYITVAQGEL